MESDSPGNRHGAGEGLRPLGQGLAAGLLISLVLWISMTTGAIEQGLVATTAAVPSVTATVPRSTATPPQPTATMPPQTAIPDLLQTPEPTQSLEPGPEVTVEPTPTSQASRDLYAWRRP
jgi:hypothetical protein